VCKAITFALVFPFLIIFLREIFCNLINAASSAAPQIPLCQSVLGLNPGLWHWQSDALTTRLDLIHSIKMTCRISNLYMKLMQSLPHPSLQKQLPTSFPDDIRIFDPLKSDSMELPKSFLLLLLTVKYSRVTLILPPFISSSPPPPSPRLFRVKTMIFFRNIYFAFRKN
jgi:hypothetical protein